MFRIDWPEYYIDIAKAVSKRASCPRASAGAVVVGTDNRIISVGYNGAPAGYPHCIDEGCVIEDGHCARAVHAEQNVIVNAPKLLVDSDLYVYFDRHEGTKFIEYEVPLFNNLSAFPCVLCRNLIIASGIASITVFDNKREVFYRYDR